LYLDGLSLKIDAYVDANYNKDPRAITGYLVWIGGTAVIWRSKQEGLSTQSAMEAEYVGLSEVLTEVMFVRQFMEEVGFGPKGPTPIFEDNKATTLLAKDHVYPYTKHIAVRYHLIRDEIAKGTVNGIWLPTKDEAADGLTKAVPKEIFERLRKEMNIREFTRSGGVSRCWIRRIPGVRIWESG
jgi:hypothetical protein